MEQYIKKSALVAVIRKRLLPVIRDKHYDEWEEGQNSERIAILGIIDTFEVKEVDLNEDINDFINEEYHYTEYDGKWVDEKDWRDSIQRCAKHFFELGLKAQKGEEV